MKHTITLLDDELCTSTGGQGFLLDINIGAELSNTLSPYALNTVGVSNVLGTMSHGDGNIFLGSPLDSILSIIPGLFGR